MTGMYDEEEKYDYWSEDKEKKTPEPLKGKMQGILGRTDEGNPKGRPIFYRSDVKSAAEGCLEEIIEEIKSQNRTGEYYMYKFKDIFKKWFEDVIS